MKIKHENIDELFTKINDELDTSSYPPEHPLYSATNKKVLGKFKNECCEDGEIKHITHFVALKAKQYSYTTESDMCIKGKGIPSNALKRDLKFEDYKKGLDGINKSVKFRRIMSKKHTLLTLELEKSAVNAFDDKRYILDSGVDTLPYGHYKISTINN